MLLMMEKMPAVLLLARAILCAVFLVAGLGKLRDRAGSRRSMIDFGVPSALAGPFGILLPVAELVVAVALLLASFAWLGAIGALGLLVLFLIGIGVNLARGRRPDCHCFGQLHSKPIGWDLVVRNILLAIVASMVIYAGPRQPSFRAWMSDARTQTSGGYGMVIVALAVLALLVFQTWLLFQLVKQGGRVLIRLEALEKQAGGKPAAEAPPAEKGLPIGETAPEFALEDLHGDVVSLEQLRGPGKPVLLLFTNPGCGPCSALLPEAAAWQRDAASDFTLALISQGTVKENLAKTNEHSIRTVLLQKEHEISDKYDALGTPSAVLVRPDGTIGSLVATGAEAIRALVAKTINESLAGLLADPLQQGAPAPPLVFPDLEGRMFNLTELRGKPAIALFWNPGCGFCQQMTDDLKIWEKKALKAGTQVVLISTGTIEANAKSGFRSRVVLDQNFSAGKAFGVTGTPSALLLDQEGKIASKIAVGKQDIGDAVFSRALTAESRA